MFQWPPYARQHAIYVEFAKLNLVIVVPGNDRPDFTTIGSSEVCRAQYGRTAPLPGRFEMYCCNRGNSFGAGSGGNDDSKALCGFRSDDSSRCNCDRSVDHALEHLHTRGH